MKNLYVVCLVGLLILSACSKDKKEALLEDTLASYVENTPDVFAFGSMDIMGMLNKADYASNKKIKAFLGMYIDELKPCLNLDKGIYYAIEMKEQIQNNQDPDVTAFLSLKNADSLRASLMESGFDFEQSKELEYSIDGDACLAMHEDLFIIQVKGGGIDHLQAMETSLKKLKMKAADDKIIDNVARVGDIHLVARNGKFNIPEGPGMGNSMMKFLKNLVKMQKDDMRVLSIFFEDGHLLLQSKNLMSDAMKKWNYMLQDDQASIRTKMGEGTPNVAFSTNIDVRMMQNFVETMAEKPLMDLLEEAGVEVDKFQMMTGDKISNLINGKTGFVMHFPKDGQVDGLPKSKAYAELGPRGEGILQMLIQDDFKTRNNIDFNITKQYVEAFNQENLSGTMQVPEGCESFGKHGVSFFVSTKGVDFSSFGFNPMMKQIEKLDYINMYGDFEGGQVKIQLVNQEENFLKQVLDATMESLEDIMSVKMN